MYVGKSAGVADVAQFIGECLFDYFAQLIAVVRHAQIIRSAHFERLDHARPINLFAEWSDEMLAVEFADGLAVYLRFREVADDEIEAIEVVPAERLFSFPGHDHFMTQATKCLFE